MERETGFEPATNSLEGCDSTPELLPQGPAIVLLSFEPSSTRSAPADSMAPQLNDSVKNGGEWRIRTSVGRGPADLQSAAFDRSANSPRVFEPSSGAGDGTRTRDLLITNQLLYQLSYASANFMISKTHSALDSFAAGERPKPAAEELRVIAECLTACKRDLFRSTQ
jgi:hypothetical protein